jgi:uncharacterized protein YjbJ (UPF0337 family)
VSYEGEDGDLQGVPGNRQLLSATNVEGAVGFEARTTLFPEPRHGVSPHRHQPTKGTTMDSDRVEGKAKEMEGEAQQKWGEAKDKARDTFEDVKDKAEDIVDGGEDRVDEMDKDTANSSTP